MSGAFDLSGRLALVTGGASGIGIGICEMLAEAGAHVVVIDVKGAEAQAEALCAAGHAASAQAIDLSDEGSIVSGVAAIVAAHGTPWALVNNAGVQDREYLVDETVSGWDRTMAVNSRGPFLMTREVGRAMIAGGAGGRIVNIASMSLRGMATKGTASYVASKGAIDALTSLTALELAEHGITANVVLPGAVLTPGAMEAKGPPVDGPARRRAPFGFNEPRDLGVAVLFFASPAARMVTNQRLAVDAGWSLS